MDMWKRRYTMQRLNAKARGIPFLLTFEEWQKLWLDSGRWEQRGFRRGQYVMARNGDAGAYAVGNVRICLCEDNHREVAREKRQMFGERNGFYGKPIWKGVPKSPEHRAAIGRGVRDAAARKRR